MSDLLKTPTFSAYRQLSEVGKLRARDIHRALRPEPFSHSMSREDLWGWLDRSRQKGLDPKEVWEAVLDLSSNREYPIVYGLDGVGVLQEQLPSWEELQAPPAEKAASLPNPPALNSPTA